MLPFSYPLWLSIDDKKKKELSFKLNSLTLTVGVTGFEPATTRPPDVYSTGLSYAPIL